MRFLVLVLFLFAISSCGRALPKRFSQCWRAQDFRDQQTVIGQVTILVTLPPPDLVDGDALVAASPTKCEKGSFAIEGRFRGQLLREAAKRSAIGESWDRAFLADVEGTVRLDRSQLEGSHPQAPERLVLSRVRNLKAISKPHWGRW
jgi:hypothetical protein